MKIIVLCHHPFCLPALQGLAGGGFVAGVVTSSDHPVFLKKLKPLVKHFNLPFLQLKRKKVKQQLFEFIRLHQPDVVFSLTFRYPYFS